ncbi:MAG TPA: hypothetical protein VKA44_02345 [Gemmatimonadota bacterium]|nr:hypothetical protein [Gemmatimonadota bacterium]
MREEARGEPADDAPPTVTYRDALLRLREEGWARIEKALYTESLDDQLARLEGEPEAASLQEVRLVRHPDRVELFRVHRAGGSEFVDQSAQAVVRR